MPALFPNRIVCLTEETVEVIYGLGEQDRIVGISGFTVRPPQARKEKPKVSAFTSAKIDRILALKPDLVLGYSDLQADIAHDLVRAGLEVHIFQQQTIAGILTMIRTLGALLGVQARAVQWAGALTTRLERARQAGNAPGARPKIYFEIWDHPCMVAPHWVSELITIAGGVDCFPMQAQMLLGKDRMIECEAVIAAAPDLIIASWCGKRLDQQQVTRRPGWEAIPAIANGQVHEILSSIILQPGPAALTDGLDALAGIIRTWQTGRPQPATDTKEHHGTVI